MHEAATNPVVIEFRVVQYGSEEYRRTVELRNEVLREPLGLVFSPEEMQLEAKDYHLALYKGGTLAACLVLVPLENGRIKMRQVAVSPRMQRQGLGRILVEHSEVFARRQGFGLMTLHARETAVPFYDALGYQRVGERFVEITLPHWEMVKELTGTGE